MPRSFLSAFKPAAAAAQLELLGQLADAATGREIAEVIVQLARAFASCTSARVVWGIDRASELESEPDTELDPDDLTLARSAAGQTSPKFSAQGPRVAVGLFQTSPSSPHVAILVLHIDTLPNGRRVLSELEPQLAIAGRHLWRALESADLQTALERLEGSERLQRALFAISDLAGSDRDMPDMLRGIHAIVGTLMYAENF
jgi:hypothetical protein